MTRKEALTRLRDAADISYDDLDQIFRAFDYESHSPSFETEVYYHPSYNRCGMFTARDDGHHVLSPQQRALVAGMLRCVTWHERQQTP